MLFYSLSTPFPKGVGIPEITVLLFLVGALLNRFLYVIAFKQTLNSLIFFLGLLIPLFFSLFSEIEGFGDIARDVIPYFYFMLPVFIFSGSVNAVRSRASFLLNHIAFLAAIVGTLFAIRELYSWSSMGGLRVGGLFKTEEYLVQSPLVLFSGNYFILLAIHNLLGVNINYRKVFTFLLLATPPILGFYFTALRAPLFFSFLMPFIYILLSSSKSKKAVLLTGFLIFAGIFFMLANFDYYFQALIKKHELVGSNNKIEEFLEVIDYVIFSDNIFRSFFGVGFGGAWYSPAVGYFVRYTHALPSYMILKMGIIGLCFFVILMFLLIKSSLRFLQVMPVKSKIFILHFSTLPSLCVNIFLESAFKTLGFGIVLSIYFACMILVDDSESEEFQIA